MVDQLDLSQGEDWGVVEQRARDIPVHEQQIEKKDVESLIAQSEEGYWKIVVIDESLDDESHFHIRRFFLQGFHAALKFCTETKLDYRWSEDDLVIELSPVTDEELAVIQPHLSTDKK